PVSGVGLRVEQERDRRSLTDPWGVVDRRSVSRGVVAKSRLCRPSGGQYVALASARLACRSFWSFFEGRERRRRRRAARRTARAKRQDPRSPDAVSGTRRPAPDADSGSASRRAVGGPGTSARLHLGPRERYRRSLTDPLGASGVPTRISRHGELLGAL